MKTILSDYYPVYKDIGVEAEMFNAEELVDLALKRGFTTFQTVLILIKNSFEGCAFFNSEIRSDKIYENGTILFQTKPQFLLLNFYENFEMFRPGLTECEIKLKALRDDLKEISFESLIFYILSFHIIRFPVEIFKAFEVRNLKSLPILNKKTMDQHLELVILCERIQSEIRFIEKVDLEYIDKFSELGQKLRLKEEAFTHFQKKFLLAAASKVETEEELDDLIYQKIVEEKLNSSSYHMDYLKRINQSSKESSSAAEDIKRTIKTLYRLISKNCSEVHQSTAEEAKFPELNDIFLRANAIVNEPDFGLQEFLYRYMKMISLLAEVLVFRKKEGYGVAEGHQLISGPGGKMITVSKDDFKMLQINLDEQISAFRMNRFTDYKINFLTDELTEIHKQFLVQQIAYIDNQILQIQKDIKEILKIKSNTHK